MDIVRLHEAACDFRRAIEKIIPSLGISFVSFPHGSCGDAALMLGTYLSERRLGEFQYMLGTYGPRAAGNWSTHGWLQAGLIVVDITADQFPDVANPVIVGISTWHNDLNGKAVNSGDYRVYDPNTVSTLGRLYRLILAEMT